MLNVRRVAPLLLTTALFLGCGDEDPTVPDSGITIADLVGSWNATADIHTNNADASQTFDVISAGGEVRFTILADGGTRTWVELGTFSDEWDSAVSVSGNTVTSDPVEAGRPTRVWTITLEAGVLTMTNSDSEFDFTLTGAAPVGTTEVVILVRS